MNISETGLAILKNQLTQLERDQTWMLDAFEQIGRLLSVFEESYEPIDQLDDLGSDARFWIGEIEKAIYKPLA